jgi:hypothetical protein
MSFKQEGLTSPGGLPSDMISIENKPLDSERACEMDCKKLNFTNEEVDLKDKEEID